MSRESPPLRHCHFLRKNPIFLLTRRFIHGIIQTTYKSHRFVLARTLYVLTKRRCKAYDYCVRQPAAAEFPLWPNVLLPGGTGRVQGAVRFALSVKTALSCYSVRELYPSGAPAFSLSKITNNRNEDFIMSERKYHFETLQLHVGQEQADPVTDSRAVPGPAGRGRQRADCR